VGSTVALAAGGDRLWIQPDEGAHLLGWRTTYIGTTFSAMTKEELHALLTGDFGLVVDLVEWGDRRSYFLERVVWHPSSTTRILHVLYDHRDRVTHIKRCISSDNNNSVFIPLSSGLPFLRQAVVDEIEMHKAANARA